MKKTISFNEMSYNEMMANYDKMIAKCNELIAECDDYLKDANIRRERERKEAVIAYKTAMANLGYSEEDMKSFLDGEESINLTEPVVIPEVVEIPKENVKEVLALPEHQEDTKVETKPTSVFDHPALHEDYNPLKTKESVPTPEPEKTSVAETEEVIPSIESLLCDDPEYQKFYHPDTPKRKNNRSLPTMDELLSGEPVNRILNLGNLTPKGAPYRQHTRVNHVDGIIPTETATGKTLVYIPAS